MHAVLGATASTGALDLRADLDLEFPSILILNRQFRRTILLNQVESFAECAIVVVHECLYDG